MTSDAQGFVGDLEEQALDLALKCGFTPPASKPYLLENGQ